MLSKEDYKDVKKKLGHKTAKVVKHATDDKVSVISKVLNKHKVDSPGFSGMHEMGIRHIKQQRMNKKIGKMYRK